MAVRLEWEGKPTHVERLALPFQTVETINESRATRERNSGSLFGAGASKPSPRNQLIWGDNRLVMSTLLRNLAGGIRLAYIDPPFATGDDFSMRVQVGDEAWVKEPSILEEYAYRDTWGAGYESYLSMMYERLVLLHELLADDGTIYVHCDWRVNGLMRMMLDEIFGSDRFQNEIIWQRSLPHGNVDYKFGASHDTLLRYSRTDAPVWNPQYAPHRPEYLKQFYRYAESDGRKYRLISCINPNPNRPNLTYEWRGVRRVWKYTKERMQRMHDEGLLVYSKNGIPSYKGYLDQMRGVPMQDVWVDVAPLMGSSREWLEYPTQKPEGLVERIIKASSNEGDIVIDVFAGSGTTAVVAEKLGRRWIACDLGRFAIHTTRKRLLDVPDCRPFDIKNLGTYERQRWQFASGNGALRAYLDTILAFYRAEPVEGFSQLHGRKAGRMVHVGATDAPVTIDETEEVMDEMADNGIESCDLLGWEWEMGLHDTITERARRRGLDVRPRQIPREVMERQVAEADAVRFFELAHVDLDVRRQGREAAVVLKDFAIPSEDLIPPKVRERLSGWSDLIDYWAVDFDFTDDVFHNQWQAYRTRQEPKLATRTEWHEYAEAGRHAIVVKIIDIFGNDTTKLAEVRIK